MTESLFLIRFLDASAAEANRYADDLIEALSKFDKHLKVERQHDRLETRDGGATLAIIAGIESVSALTKGIAAWLARHSHAKIQMSVDGSVIASKLDSSNAARIVEAFRKNDDFAEGAFGILPGDSGKDDD